MNNPNNNYGPNGMNNNNGPGGYSGINGYNQANPYSTYPVSNSCQVVRTIHPVQYVSYSDNSGRWALYTQISVTKNVGNRCHVNEVILISHRQPSGWFWNPKKLTLMQYTQEEPRFATRQVPDPFNAQQLINVNLSRAHESPNTSLRSVFTDYIARLVLGVGHNDAKWLETARQLSSQMKQNTLYFQYVKRHPNAMAVPLVPLPPMGNPQALQMSIQE